MATVVVAERTPAKKKLFLAEVFLQVPEVFMLFWAPWFGLHPVLVKKKQSSRNKIWQKR
jgi:hypothetical protein